ncbi:MAG: hypothetical protein LUD39_06000, partial [Opitutae bacterium]|nr:hypothetical protein [Opitutae bacterium]
MSPAPANGSNTRSKENFPINSKTGATNHESFRVKKRPVASLWSRARSPATNPFTTNPLATDSPATNPSATNPSATTPTATNAYEAAPTLSA